MREHPDGKPGKRIAVVLDDLCASCGICAGACPSSTPFRSGEALVTGIDMPQLPVDAMRARLERALADGKTLVVFGCDSGAPVTQFGALDVAAWSVPCIAQVPPSFVDYALRTGARGVLVARCPEHDCEFREGSRWAAERLAGTREPHLRPSVPQSRCGSSRRRRRTPTRSGARWQTSGPSSRGSASCRGAAASSGSMNPR
jgi:ferredoxin